MIINRKLFLCKIIIKKTEKNTNINTSIIKLQQSILNSNNVKIIMELQTIIVKKKIKTNFKQNYTKKVLNKGDDIKFSI